MKQTTTTCRRFEMEVYDRLLEYASRWNTRLSMDAMPLTPAGRRSFRVELLDNTGNTYEWIDESIALAMGKVLAMIKEAEDAKA